MKNLTVNLMVRNVNDTVDFYRNILGFELSMSVPEKGVFDWAMVTKESVSIMFQEEKNIKNEYSCLKNREISPSFTMYIKTENVKGIYETLKDKVNIVLDYHKTFYGSYEFAIEDINRYILTFSE